MTDPLARLLAVLGVEHFSERGGDEVTLIATAVHHHVSEEMDGAALPRAAQHASDRAPTLPAGQLVLSFVAMVRTLNAQIKQLEGQIRTQVRAHPDGPIFLSGFKSQSSVITAAELLVEIGDCRERYPTRDALAADAGHAAVAKESGKRKTAGVRWGCNKRLRTVFCRLADSSRHWHPWAQELYAQARQRGHEHPRAIRTLGRAWCRIVWQCWRHRTLYDPTRHQALQRHIAVTIPTTSGPRPDLAATQRMAGPRSLATRSQHSSHQQPTTRGPSTGRRLMS